MDRRIIETLTGKYKHTLWGNFVKAIDRYQLLSDGDRVAVCISGGKDSTLMALLFQLYAQYGEKRIEVRNLVMDPGYGPATRERIESNLSLLGLDAEIFSSDIFEITDSYSGKMCYLCAKMRRGCLYRKARDLGCNKIALGHHFNDVIETTLLGMFYASKLEAMIPKRHSDNYEGMELVRPMYLIHEEDIISWAEFNGLEFIPCSCRFSQLSELDDEGRSYSKRKEIKELLHRLREDNPDIEKSIFNSLHKVCLETFPGWKSDGLYHSFLEDYDK